jgi:CubicO group peptidase (beta-lactamase class C family)
MLILAPLAAAIWLAQPAIAQVFPGATWATQTPAQVGLEIARLDAFRDFLGGQGCIVRHGYMVYTWGDQSRRQDVASACKPVISHLLFKAIEDGRLKSLDEPVTNWQPCLQDLNADLDYKDRAMTFRHMATQTSGYGVREKPGTAFDYNDWQMALLWDTLFLKVYVAQPETVDEKVLHALLTDPLQCQDQPTFLFFGPDDRAGRLGISVRDFARFGLLYLRQGNWCGKQLLSREHAVMAVSSPLPNSIPRTAGQSAEMCPNQRTLGSQRVPDNQTDHLGSYSLLWWTNGLDRTGQRMWPDAPLDTFGAFGHENGQRAVVVIPSLDMVVSWNDTTLDQKPGNPRNEAFKLLRSAVRPATIVVDHEHPAYFKYADGRPFFLCGPGDPEDFLYRGQRHADGTRDGDQMALIQKLAGTGANCIYLMAVRSHGGDGDATHNPFVDGDPAKPLNEDLLQQWETWFTAMDQRGIAIFFILYDDDAAPFGKELPPDGRLKPAEADFIDALVRRFKHHEHLIWCVAEEYAEALTPAHAGKICERIKQRDDRHHPVAIHQNHGTRFDFDAKSGFDQFAVQWNANTPAELHAAALAARKSVHGRLNVNLAEFADSRVGEPSAGHGETLERKIWAIALAGGYSMILGMDIASTPVSDLEACGRLVRFMEATRFTETTPHDELARGDTRYVLAEPGKTYIAYGESGQSLGLAMPAGRYHVRWYDPRAGVWIDAGMWTAAGGEATFTKPAAIQREMALYVVSEQVR